MDDPRFPHADHTRLVVWLRVFILIMTPMIRPGIAQVGKRAVAQIEVTAVDAFGRPIADTNVYSFIDENGDDKVGRFDHARAAGVPYGRYRIAVQARGDYRPSEFGIDVANRMVHVTAGLQAYGVENTVIRGRLKAMLVGDFPKAGPGSCRAAGVYLRIEADSNLSAGRVIDFGDVPVGLYTLTCVIGKEVSAPQVVAVTADATTVVFPYKQIDVIGRH